VRRDKSARAFLSRLALTRIVGSIMVAAIRGASGFLVGSAAFKAVEAAHGVAWWVRFPSAPDFCNPRYGQPKNNVVITAVPGSMIDQHAVHRGSSMLR